VASALAEIENHIDEVAQGQRQHVRDAIALLVAAVNDNTVPKSKVVGAVEIVSEKSPKIMDRLKKLCGKATDKAGELIVQKAIEYVMQSGPAG
jgi:hypothetical protein